ncbi:MAG: winged helix-turn-helix transcriptional regulator [Lachnospiraceae bacterium]|nr:winged helix-turn-helix transcriptional regulator [Lachnospiraceae bacterium]
MEISMSIRRSIRRLHRGNQKFATMQSDHPDLTPSELQLLRHVGFHGEVSQRHLAETLGVDKAMISRMLQKLEEKGYLARKEDENDARSKKVVALPPAREIHLEGKGLSEQFYDKITEEFSAGELELLDRMLKKMADNGRELNQALEGKKL